MFSLIQTLEDVTDEEFVAFMKMLSAVPTMTTMQGRKELVDIVAEQAELDSPFDVRSLDKTDILKVKFAVLPNKSAHM